MVSPECLHRLLNLNRCTISEGGGSLWFLTKTVSSVQVFDLGKAGATKSQISVCMGAHQTLSRFLSASSISLASK